VSGAVEWLPGNRVRIPVTQDLAQGDYVVVPGGDLSADPTFGFSVT
jgi:hypothetical protein